MILITGADGRVGKRLIYALLKNKEKVRAFVRKTGKIKKNKNIEIFQGDILDKKALKQAMRGVTVVYHLAAIVDYTVSSKIMRQINVEGTRNLLKAAGKRKVILMSSTAVMGKKLPKIPADERTYCKPTNIYGHTKLDAEKLAIKNGAIVIRSPSIYGPGFEEGYFQIFEQLKKKKLPIIGNGKNMIQFTHIYDLIDALVLAKNKGKRGQVYIIAGKDIKTQKELLEIVCKLLKVSPPKKHVSLEIAKFLAKIQEIKSKVKKTKPKLLEEYIDKLSSNRVFNIEKAREELGYNPKIKYERGIAEMVDLFRKRHQRGKRK